MGVVDVVEITNNHQWKVLINQTQDLTLEFMSLSKIGTYIDTTQKPRPIIRLSDYHYCLLVIIMEDICSEYTQCPDYYC